jgi:hypothetical protein
MNFTVYQIKWLINEYNLTKAKNKPLIEKYKSKRKAELLKIIHDNNINPSNYEIPSPPKRDPPQILKKYDKKPYNESEQIEFQKNLKKNKRYKNPLISPNDAIDLKPQLHQRNFIRQFIFSGLRGAIAYHGVGSGKTLTAVISSYYYLKLNPKNKILVISPSALLYNFVEGMIQYGLDISDNRYTFLTYDQYLRKKLSGENSLVIVDEAHNFRTPITTTPLLNKEGKVIGEVADSNIKGYTINVNALKKADKVILLTGTAFVNRLIDIENLLSWIDNRKPLNGDSFSQMLGSDASLIDHFNYRISYFESPKDNNFPERRDFIVPFLLSDDENIKYNRYKIEGLPSSKSDKPNSFYSAERGASTFLKEGKISRKNQYTVNLIKKSNQKFIIYVTLYDNGLIQLTNALKMNNIMYVIISGRESKTQKEINKKLFNFYNFKNDKLFTNENTSPEDFQYINNKYRVLIITKAGAEGVDTKNCQNLIMMNGVWNQAMSEQIIARAIRYKSHFGLNVNERYVNVYKYFMCRDEKEKEQLDIMTSNVNFNYVELLSSVREEMRLIAKEAKGYGSTQPPAIDVLVRLGLQNRTTYKSKRMGYGKKNQMVVDVEGRDKYEDLKYDIKEHQKKYKAELFKEAPIVEEHKRLSKSGLPDAPYTIKLNDLQNILNIWLFKTYKRLRPNVDNANDEKDEDGYAIKDASFTIDIYLFVLSMAKQQNINEFLSALQDSTIKRFEEFKTKLSKELEKYSKEHPDASQNKLDKAELKLYKIQGEILNVLKSSAKQITKEQRREFEKRQQYYTEPENVRFLYEASNINKQPNDKILKILEPSAGSGNILSIISLLIKDNNKTAMYDMIEIDDKNRTKLKKLELLSPSYTLLEQGNFLLSFPNKSYDYIFMNPPFHLRKREVFTSREVWDVDFVIRAFAFLEIGGELHAIISTKYKREKNLENELYKLKKYSSFSETLLSNQTFSNNVKIDIMQLKIVKKNTNYDKEILDKVFYPDVKASGVQILNSLELLDLDDEDKNLKLPSNY